MKQYDKWFFTNWRPCLAWLYIVIVAFDFLFAPVLNVLAVKYYGIPYHEWHPLTLEGGGLFHVAIGSFLGLTSWQRSNEKISYFNNGLGGGIVERNSENLKPTKDTDPEKTGGRAD